MMAGERQKVSFVLQFVRTGTPEGWRGRLQEVESGDRRSVTSLGGLAGALAAHGVTLVPDLDELPACPLCGSQLGGRA